MRGDGTGPEARARNVPGPTIERRTNAVDAVFDALADEQRRVVLQHVIDRPSGGIGFEELADRIHDREHAPDDGIAVWDDRERIRCRLYHAHLPKLDEAGIVEFDRITDTVRPTVEGRRLALCRDLLEHAGG